MSALKKNYEDLANAIVKQAVDDYQMGLLSEMTSENRKYVRECEEFFKSGWCQSLTKVDGNVIIERCRKITSAALDEKIKKLASKHLIQDRVDKFCKLLPFVYKDVLVYLIENNFFSAPASTRYHGAHEGGLFDHSYEMTQTLVDLTTKNNLKWCRPESPLIIGMFHDICKIDEYIIEDSTISHNPNVFDDEHGGKSVRILDNLIELTGEEMACIKHHMGAFTNKAQWVDYSSAIKRFPNVLWTHQADMIASHIKGV